MGERSYCWVYILECENGSYYTGYAVDLRRRWQEHHEGSRSAKFTRAFKPIRVAQSWKVFGGTGNAMKVEHLIKSAGRAQKDEIVKKPRDLAKMIRASKLKGTRIRTARPSGL